MACCTPGGSLWPYCHSSLGPVYTHARRGRLAAVEPAGRPGGPPATLPPSLAFVLPARSCCLLLWSLLRRCCCCSCSCLQRRASPAAARATLAALARAACSASQRAAPTSLATWRRETCDAGAGGPIERQSLGNSRPRTAQPRARAPSRSGTAAAPAPAAHRCRQLVQQTWCGGASSCCSSRQRSCP